MAGTKGHIANSQARSTSIETSDFTTWSSKHHYRTSSLDMSHRTPASSKTYVIPGYAGFVPGIADSPLEKNATWTSKEQFCREKYLPERTTSNFPSRPFTTSKGLGSFGGGLEDEYHTISRFHGKTTIPMTHPNYQDNLYQTTSTVSYVNQEALRNRIYRKTSYEPTRSKKVSKRPCTTASGFVQNSTLFDGHGWLPIEKLHGDMTISEYRTRFNPEVPFHPRPHKANTRKMKERSLVY